MDQPCYKCGQVVEEGRVFCPHCGAPQIRVLVTEPPAAATLIAGTEGLSGERVLPASQTVPVLALPVQWSRALKPCLLAALVASVLMVLRLYPVVAMLSAGFLSVVFYRQGEQNFPLKLPGAIRIGAFGGLLSSGFLILMTAVAASVPDLRSQIHEKLLKMAHEAIAANTGNPAAEWMLRELKTVDGFFLVVMVSCAAGLVMSLLLGSAGGAIAGVIFGRRER